MHNYQALLLGKWAKMPGKRVPRTVLVGVPLLLLGLLIMAQPALAQSGLWLGAGIITASNQDPNSNNNHASLCLSTANNPLILTTATVSAAMSDPDLTNNTATSCLSLLTNASLGDRIWEDANGNGVQDAGEPGLAGFTVQIFNSNDVLLAEATSDSNGYYFFANLVPGDYYLLIIPPATP